MAKKKKKRQHRRPVAPPVHSAPDAVHAPPTRPSEAFSARPASPEPPTASEPLHDAPVFEPAPAPTRRKPQPRRRPPSRRRRRRSRSRYVIPALLAVALVAGLVVWQVNSRRQASRFDRIAATAGCGKVREVGGLGRTHTTNERVEYSTSPPVGGPHDPAPLCAGTYPQPLSTDPAQKPSIYQAVHSLEHGFVIVWYKDLKPEEVQDLTGAVAGEREVMLVPHPEMSGTNKVALTAWGRLQYCSRPSARVATAFIERYRNARSAPEAINQ